MASNSQVFSLPVCATAIKHGVISTSTRSTVEKLPSIPEGSTTREFPAVSEDGTRVYLLILRRRMVGRYPKETIGGAGMKKFIKDYGLEVGDRIVLYKDPGVCRLSNALLTDDCYILGFVKQPIV